MENSEDLNMQGRCHPISEESEQFHLVGEENQLLASETELMTGVSPNKRPKYHHSSTCSEEAGNGLPVNRSFDTVCSKRQRSMKMTKSIISVNNNKEENISVTGHHDMNTMIYGKYDKNFYNGLYSSSSYASDHNLPFFKIISQKQSLTQTSYSSRYNEPKPKSIILSASHLAALWITGEQFVNNGIPHLKQMLRNEKKMSPDYSSSYAPAHGFSHTKQSFFKAQSSMDCHIEIDEEENASDQISVSTFYGQNGNGGAKRRKMAGVPEPEMMTATVHLVFGYSLYRSQIYVDWRYFRCLGEDVNQKTPTYHGVRFSENAFYFIQKNIPKILQSMMPTINSEEDVRLLGQGEACV